MPSIRLPRIAFRSERALIFAAALSWATLMGAAITAFVDAVYPGLGYLVAIPVEGALLSTSAWLAFRVTRKRDLIRRPEEILNEEERLAENYERDKLELEGMGLSDEQLREEKLKLFGTYRSARRELGAYGSQALTPHTLMRRLQP